MNKYLNLAWELNKQYNMRLVLILIAGDVLGTIPKR